MSLFGSILNAVGKFGAAAISSPLTLAGGVFRGLEAITTPSTALQVRQNIPAVPGIIKTVRTIRKRRKRSKKRFTTNEIQDLLIAKMIFGPRSPVMTILGLKTIGRGEGK